MLSLVPATQALTSSEVEPREENECGLVPSAQDAEACSGELWPEPYSREHHAGCTSRWRGLLQRHGQSGRGHVWLQQFDLTRHIFRKEKTSNKACWQNSTL